MKGNKYKKWVLVSVSMWGFFVFIYLLVGVEQYNYVYPHIDTQFTETFTISGFERIQKGMTKPEVQQILGTPFHFSKAQKQSIDKQKETVEFSENYSHDGKFKVADFAWEAFDIYYDKDTLVVAKKRQWYYD